MVKISDGSFSDRRSEFTTAMYTYYQLYYINYTCFYPYLMDDEKKLK